MKVSYELKQGYIDVWNEESEEWDRYIKVHKKSIVEEEKKIPEKLEDISEIKCVECKVEINIAGNKTLFDTDTPIVTEHCIYKINQLIKNQKKIIDYLKSKGE